MNLLVGITGKARAGKDTFAAGMTQRGFTQSSLADPLKVIVAYIADEPLDLYYEAGPKEEYTEALGMTRRLALQKMGTEGVRNSLGPDTWTRRLIRRWRRHNCPATVVPDVRFDNEAAAIINAGGMVIEIVRPDNAILSGESATHISEAGISSVLVSHTVHNRGTMEEFIEEARRFAEFLQRDGVGRG